ncbi:MAG: type II secretion system protein [Patescibacteria group bacterium]|nr:type II secretion system protein [Patescibacteria group bacterium]
MLQVFRKSEKGFTLIELLVVIAIIGVLSTIVLISLNTARQKARDVRRLSDMRQVALGLEMYYDDNGGYPSNAVADDEEWAAMKSALETDGYITSVPSDPGGVTTGYAYHPDGTTANGAQNYILNATLENDNHSALDSDIDAATFGCTCTDPEYCIQP